MKLLLQCSVMALLGTLLGMLAFAVTDERRDPNAEPRDILLIDKLHGNWLTIGRVNHKEPGGEFSPNWTYIKTEQGIIPVIKKRGDSYQISFTSEITKNLPSHE